MLEFRHLIHCIKSCIEITAFMVYTIINLHLKSVERKERLHDDHYQNHRVGLLLPLGRLDPPAAAWREHAYAAPAGSAAGSGWDLFHAAHPLCSAAATAGHGALADGKRRRREEGKGRVVRASGAHCLHRCPGRYGQSGGGCGGHLRRRRGCAFLDVADGAAGCGDCLCGGHTGPAAQAARPALRRLAGPAYYIHD